MSYAVVLNGCTDDFLSQAEEVNGFLFDNAVNLLKGKTIILYTEDEHKRDLIKNSPTSCVQLIKVVRYQPEAILEILKQTEANQGVDLYLFPGDFAGRELAVRFAYRMGGSSLVAVNKLEIKEEMLILQKAVYSNYLQGKFLLRKKPYCVAIAKGSADRLPSFKEKLREISEFNATAMTADSYSRDYEFIVEEGSSGLEHSKFIVVAGQGIKSKEKIVKLQEVAKRMGAEFGVSRPVAMSALAPLNQLVGVSGVITKPELCIAVAVSGAAAFLVGIEKSKYLVAINTDRDAPIVKAADIAIIDDYENVLAELVKLLPAQP